MLETVEFRLVQVVLSYIGDDRITVGLFQWDGKICRAAINVSKLVPGGLKRSIGEIRSALKSYARTLFKSVDGNLERRLPIREGLGCSFPYWRPVVSFQTSNPNSHFEELRIHFGLREVVFNQRRGTVSLKRLKNPRRKKKPIN